jgi:hypothetical protein
VKKSAALTLGVLVLDQATKALLRATVPFGHEIPLLPLFSIVNGIVLFFDGSVKTIHVDMDNFASLSGVHGFRRHM